MNLLLLAAGLRVWRGSPIEILTRLFAAIGVFSLEMQIATWTGAATLRSLVPVSALLAAALWWWAPRFETWVPPAGRAQPHGRYMMPAALALAALAAFLNFSRPLTAADPYHLERITRIEHGGTLAYDPGLDPNDARLNVLNYLYELSLADIRQAPFAGPVVVRGHGLLGVALYALTAWSLVLLLRAAATWLDTMLFAIPLVFHQLVLVKNDLFGAVPGALVLAWIVGRLPAAPPPEFFWAGWFAGMAVSIKVISHPIVIAAVLAAIVLRRDRRPILMLALGGLTGALAGGTFFTLIENARHYAGPFAPWLALTGRPVDAADSLTSVARMAISLFDLGVLTHIIWPRAGGWGGTYGLPAIWAFAVLLYCIRRAPEAQRVLVIAAGIWLISSATNIDIGTNQRYVLAPGLAVVATAVALAAQPGLVPRWLRLAGAAAIALSVAQMLRSTALYLSWL